MILSDCYLACITGATSELGSSLAYLLAKEGIPLMLTGRDRQKLEKLKGALPEAKILVANLTTKEGRLSVCQWIERWKPNLIINNAGAGLYGRAADLDIDEQMDLIELNVLGATEITLTAVQMLQREKRYGVVLNVSSAASFYPYPYFSTYAPSKSFITQFSQTLDYEMREHQIRVLAACPGMIRTHFALNASKGRLKRAPGSAMTPLHAAKKIIRQVIKEKPVTTFGPIVRFGLFCFRFLPRELRLKILARTLKNRL